MKTANVDAPLERLYREYAPKIYTYVCHHFASLSSEEAEDIAQDTFLKAMQTYDQTIEKKVIPWLYRIARNLAIDALRRKKVLSKHDPGISLDHLASWSDGRDLQAEYAQGEPVQQAFACLSKEHQRLLVLVVEGYSLQQIGDIVGRPKGTIKSYLYRARKSFKQYYQG